MNEDVYASYIDCLFDPESFNSIRDKTVAAIRESKIEFDTIAFTGFSGALIGPTIADALNKRMVLIRKDGDSTHSCNRFEGYKSPKNYIIIDDFICLGNTVKRIWEAMNKMETNPILTGIFLYREDDSDRTKIALPSGAVVPVFAGDYRTRISGL